MLYTSHFLASQLDRYLENPTNFALPRDNGEQQRLVRNKLSDIYESWRQYPSMNHDREVYHNFGNVALLHVDLRALSAQVFQLQATRTALFTTR